MKKIPFSTIEKNLNITLTTSFLLGDLLNTKSKESGQDGFVPWFSWSLPFADSSTHTGEKSCDENLLGSNIIKYINDAYKLLNVIDKNINTKYKKINVKNIEPNPHWNADSDKMHMAGIKFWAIVIKEAGLDNYPDCIMTVRPSNGIYQAVNHHYQLAALRMLNVDEITASVINLTDSQMEKRLNRISA